MKRIKRIQHALYFTAVAFCCLWLFQAIGQAQSQSTVATQLHARAQQMRDDWHTYWDIQDLPLEHQMDQAYQAGDAAKGDAIRVQRAALRKQYEALVATRINDGHTYLGNQKIKARYKLRGKQAAAEDAADFAKFLESVADGLK